MKYRLAKDLPFAEKGSEVRFNEDNFCFEVKVNRYENIEKYVFIGWSNKDDLIRGGWIEESTPIEIWVNQHKDGSLKQPHYYSKESAIFHLTRTELHPSHYKQVKFIEVIE